MKIALFKENPEADFVVCKLGGFYNDYNGTSNDPPFYGFEGWLRKSNINDFFTQDYKINSCAAMLRKKIFEKVGWATNISCENDLEFYIHVLAQGFVGFETSRVGYHYRQHADSMTGNFFAGNTEMRESQVVARKEIVSLLAKHNCLTRAVVRSNLILAMKLNRNDLKAYILTAAQEKTPGFYWNSIVELNYQLVGALYRKTGKGLRFLMF